VKRRKRAGTRKLFDGPVHDRIKKLRLAKHIRQVDFADMVGVTKAEVWHWENRFSRPTITQLPRIAKALGTTVDDLIRGEEKAA